MTTKIKSGARQSVCFIWRFSFYLNLLYLPSSRPFFFQKPVFPFLQCTIRFCSLDFDIDNFDAYDLYFDEDSVLTLAQTGKYIGTEAIEEYVKFQSSDYSIFFADSTTLKLETTFQGYDRETDECIFLGKYFSMYLLNPNVTSSETRYHTIASTKLKFSFKKRKISNIDIFYYEPFLNQVFGELVSDGSREYICSVVDEKCVGIISPIFNCTNEMQQLPVSGNNSYADGYSQSCRVIHAMLAESKPENHCAHIAINATMDPFGALKCQESAGITPDTLFSMEEQMELDEYALSNGIDPAFGYMIISETNE